MSEQPRDDPPAVRRTVPRREFLAAAGVAGLGLVAACGQAGSAPAAGGGSTAGPEVVKVRVGVIAGLAETVFQYLGQEQGFFRDEGIDVEFTEFQAGGP